MLYRFDEKLCLNGLWNLKPLFTDKSEMPPADGFDERKYLVPSFYNRSRESVRLPGSRYFGPLKPGDERLFTDDIYLPYDNYGYPGSWSKADGVWVCRNINVEKLNDKRYFLVFESIGPFAELYVNGRKLAEYHDPTLPHYTDITEALISGENSIACFIRDFDRHLHRAMWPSGGITNKVKGILGDVYLLERSDVYIEDVTVVTSVRKKTINFAINVKNVSDVDFDGKLRLDITGWNFKAEETPSGEVYVKIKAHSQADITIKKHWENPHLWDTDTPDLYMAEFTIADAQGGFVCNQHERFGFREVWIEGQDIMLNTHPVHMFADWGHRSNLVPFTSGWVEKWMGMIRDYNMNHSRLHTAPHPEFILEMADEKGIMITDETAMYGSEDNQAASYESYWEYAREHVRRFVKRDKNHPCLLLWSCENEMRWSGENYDMCKKELPRIRALFNELDPTRPAYHEGDSSVWNEREQDIVSRHYGKECTGIGWWDHARPLHSGEIGLYHYSGPNNTVQFGGDNVWTDQNLVNHCAVEETERVVMDARANGVCALGPWNFSCLLNPRMHEEVTFTYDDLTVPGIKPLFIHENTAEFIFWENGKGYTPSPDADKIRFMFRPFAAIDLSLRRSYFADRSICKEIIFVNDTYADVKDATAILELKYNEKVIRDIKHVSVRRGRIERSTFLLEPACFTGKAILSMTVSEDDRVLDNWNVEVTLDTYKKNESGLSVYVIGDGSSEPVLRATGIQFTRVSDIDNVPDGETLIIERNTIKAGSEQNHEIASLCARYGRVILLEQRYSVFPNIEMCEKPLQTAFVRDRMSVAVKGMSDSELCYWGDAPYSLLSGDTYVASSVYRKDSLGRMHVIIDSGEGNFGDGDLESALVFSSVEEKGIVYACQMAVTDKYNVVAAAGRLLVNLVKAAKNFCSPEHKKVVFCEHKTDINSSVEYAFSGGTSVVVLHDVEDVEILNTAAKTNITVLTEDEGTYNCVKNGDPCELAGLSNADITGIERVSYCPEEAENNLIADMVIDYTDGLTPILTTAPESCQRPFFVYGCMSEFTRASTMTKFCINHEEKTYIVMGRLNVGKGILYVSTFRNPKTNGGRLARLYNVLLSNISLEPVGSSLLNGACTRSDSLKGNGSPERLFAMQYSPKDHDKLLAACAYQVERMNIRTILGMYEMKPLLSDSEGFLVDKGKTVIYGSLVSQKKRAQQKNNDWLPDPLAQTFLDIGLTNGTADIFINGTHVAHVNDKENTVADICIERGLNHVLILTDTETIGHLNLRWHNIMGEAEGGFEFD